MSRDRKYKFSTPPKMEGEPSPAEIIEAPGKFRRATGTLVQPIQAGRPVEIIEEFEDKKSLGQASSDQIAQVQQPSRGQEVSIPLCSCGCGQPTKGGSFLQGHDAKLRAAIEKMVGGLLPLHQFVETARRYAMGELSAEEYQRITREFFESVQPLHRI